MTLFRVFCLGKGLTGIEFTCEDTGNPRSRVGFADDVGFGRGEKNIVKMCPGDTGYWLVGLHVMFGGPHIGVTEIQGICHWPTEADQNKKIEYINSTIPQYSYDLKGEQKGWEKSERLRCEYNYAVWGLRVKEGPTGLVTDEPGITQVEIKCCPFPQPYFCTPTCPSTQTCNVKRECTPL